MEQEAGVADDPRLRRGDEAREQELLEVDVGLMGLHHRQGDLHPAVLASDGAVVLADYGHAAARGGLHLARQRGKVVPGLAHGVDHHHTRDRLRRFGREGLGNTDARLVGFDLSAEAFESSGVAGGGSREFGEEFPLRFFRDLRTLRVEGRQGCHALHQKERHRRKPVGRLLGTRPVEGRRVGVQPVVDGAERLHGGGEAVRVGIGYDGRILADELADLDEARTRRVLGAVADDGVAAHQFAHAIRRVGDLLLARVARTRDIVMVADDHFNATGDQGFDRRHQVRRARGVDEDHPGRALHGRQDIVLVGGSEELGEVDRGTIDCDAEHVSSPAPEPRGAGAQNCA